MALMRHRRPLERTMTLIMHVILIISVRAVSSNGIRIGLPRTLTMVSSAAILIVLLAIAQAAAQTVDKAKHIIEGVRDARYCEIIPVVRTGCVSSAPSTT